MTTQIGTPSKSASAAVAATSAPQPFAVVVQQPPAAETEKPFFYSPVAGGLVTLLGVALTLWYTGRRARFDADQAAMRQQRELEHKTIEAQRERLQRARKDLYLEILELTARCQQHLTLMSGIDASDGSAIVGPASEFGTALAKMSLLAELETIAAARDFSATLGEIFVEALAKVAPISTKRFDLKLQDSEFQSAIDAMNQISLEWKTAGAESQAVRDDRRQRHENWAARADQSMQAANQLRNEIAELVFGYNDWIQVKITGLMLQFSGLQTRLRKELDVNGDISDLDEQTTELIARYSAAHRSLTTAVRSLQL